MIIIMAVPWETWATDTQVAGNPLVLVTSVSLKPLDVNLDIPHDNPYLLDD